MKNIATNLLGLFLIFTIIFFSCEQNASNKKEHKIPRVERLKLRDDYFFNKLKDPKTNTIPANVRNRELAFSKKLQIETSNKRVASTGAGLVWNEIGPADVGGRTRALAQDMTNANIIYAGGVSGGIWKSIDGGTTWIQKLPTGSHLSITSIAQDPSATSIWYATSGEISEGGSSSGKNGAAGFYLGSGIYKSTDNGESWSLMTYEQNPLVSDTYVRQINPELKVSSLLQHPFQLTSKVIVEDFNGTSAIFICTQYWGIWVSSDGGNSFGRFAADEINGEDPVYSDIVVDDQGIITLWFGPTNSGNNGFFRSYDGGGTFLDVTPTSYPTMSDNSRTILAEYQSGNIVYAFNYDGSAWDGSSHLFYFDFSNLNNEGGTFSQADRSANLPDFSRSIFGGSEDFTTQGGYDMTLAVKPDDPNFVVLGYVNLIKSDDGFATSPTTDPAKYWIGGNENPWRLDENLAFDNTHHADQHIVFFDQFNSDKVWSGHDGGICKTSDITANRVSWVSLNNDYNVTQFYTVSAGLLDGESYVIGGTQDNGTPHIDHSRFTSNLQPSFGDLSSGDGSYSFAGSLLVYSSAQEGALVIYDSPLNTYIGYLEREDLDRLFIHPFTVDPNDEGTLFFSTNGNGIIARNTQIDEALFAQDIDLVNNNWEDFDIVDQVQMTALKVTNSLPAHRLYFGGSLGGDPVLYTWENANTSDINSINGRYLTEIPYTGIWLNDIAINPTDGDELILVYSNYNINGLYHSTDGGDSFVSIEGNLGTNDDLSNQGFTGPSLRAAEIGYDENGKKYFVATSIGLYSTSILDGSNTQWTLETDLLGNIVIEDLDYRAADSALAVGTHGRGLFMGVTSNKAPIIWDGSQWSNQTGPTWTNNVLIAGNLNLQSALNVKNLTIESAYSMTVSTGNTLAVYGDIDVNGALTIESGASLITFDGATITGNVIIKRNTRYDGGKYSFVGSPIEQNANTIGANLGSWVYKYNENAVFGADGLARWEDASGDEIVTAKGYAQAGQREVVFTGTPNAGTIVYSGTYTNRSDQNDGWNLVSNPYPSAISYTEFMNDNTNNSGSIYIWDDHGSDQGRGSNSDYIVVNASGNTNSTAGNISRYNGYIGSAQGFFIQLDGQGGNNIVFEEDQREAGNNLDDNFFRKSENLIGRVRINLTSSDGLFRQALIAWNNSVDDSRINRMYDSRHFNQEGEYAVYTSKQEQKLAIQTVTKEKEMIPIGFNVSESGDYMLQFDTEEYEGELILKDKMLNKKIEVNHGSYSFNSKAGHFSDRFELIVPKSVLSAEITQVWRAFMTDNILHISPMNENQTETIRIYSLSGHTLHTSTIETDTRIDLNGLRSGIYLVSNGREVKRIIVE